MCPETRVTAHFVPGKSLRDAQKFYFHNCKRKIKVIKSDYMGEQKTYSCSLWKI